MYHLCNKYERIRNKYENVLVFQANYHAIIVAFLLCIFAGCKKQEANIS